MAQNDLITFTPGIWRGISAAIKHPKVIYSARNPCHYPFRNTKDFTGKTVIPVLLPENFVDQPPQGQP